MKRKDGFIILEDEVDYNQKSSRYLYSNLKGTVILKDGQRYFYKRIKKDCCYRELIASEIAKILNISCCDYDLAMIPKISGYDYGVISKWYRKTGADYYSGKQIIEDYYGGVLNKKVLDNVKQANYIYNNLEVIWDAFDHRYRFEKEKEVVVKGLMSELVVRFWYAYLIRNTDFHFKNWEVEETKDGICLTPAYDNEDAWEAHGFTTSKFTVNAHDNNFDNNVIILLNQTNKELVNKLMELFCKYDQETFLRAFNVVEEKIAFFIDEDLKSLLLSDFNRCYKKNLKIIK